MVILASQSRYRKKQLRDFGIPFRAVRPSADETLLKRQWMAKNGIPRKPADFIRLVQFLAMEKADSVADRFVTKGSIFSARDIFIIGSDQMAVVDGKKLDKPGSHGKAIQQLKSMRGKTHYLITAVAVVKISRHTRSIHSRTVTAKIEMRNFTKAEMLATLKADKPYDCAGSYKLEKSGLQLVEEVQVSDASAIIGLPLIATYDLLRKAGYRA